MKTRWDGGNLGDRKAVKAAGAWGFVACPAPLQGLVAGNGGWAQELYRLAYEQARAALEPARPIIFAVSLN